MRRRHILAATALLAALSLGDIALAVPPLSGGTVHGHSKGRAMSGIWTQMLSDMREQCAAQGGTFQVVGDGTEAQLGTDDIEFYIGTAGAPQNLRTASFTTHYLLRGPDPRLATQSAPDNCTATIHATRTAHLESLNGSDYSQIDIDLDRKTGRRHRGRPQPWMSTQGPQRLEKALQAGYVRDGTAVVSGLRCTKLRMDSPPPISNTVCLLDQQINVPRFAVGLTIDFSTSAMAVPGEQNTETVTDLEFDRPIDPKVFDVPAGVRIK